MEFCFSNKKRFWIGIEEEVWTINLMSGLLVDGSLKVFPSSEGLRFHRGTKPELPAQQLEAITPPCNSLEKLEKELTRNERTLQKLALRYDFGILRHPMPPEPFQVRVFPTNFNLKMHARQKENLRTAYTAGLHIHVGLGGKDEAIRCFNHCRNWLPKFLFLSLRNDLPNNKGSRRFLTLGKPETLEYIVPPALKDWRHFMDLAESLGFIHDMKLCPWLLRIHSLGTLELRVCDIQADVPNTLRLANAFKNLVVASSENNIRSPNLGISKLSELCLKVAKGETWPQTDFDFAGI